jgi:hypothetical protein
VKPGSAVALVGGFEAPFTGELLGRGALVAEGKDPAAAELILLRADAAAALDRVPGLAAGLRRGSALWVVAPKGKGSPVPESAVLAAGRAAGLTDTKVARFSATHTAHRFVPRKD